MFFLYFRCIRIKYEVTSNFRNRGTFVWSWNFLHQILFLLQLSYIQKLSANCRSTSMEISASPETMDEFLLRKCARKLIVFLIINSCSVVEKHVSCLIWSKNFPHSRSIFQNTNCRKQHPPLVGHWVYTFLNWDVTSFTNVFYDFLGKKHVKYNFCVPKTTISVNTVRYQPSKTKLCGLYCLLFVLSFWTCWSVDKYSTQTLSRLLLNSLL